SFHPSPVRFFFKSWGCHLSPPPTYIHLHTFYVPFRLSIAFPFLSSSFAFFFLLHFQFSLTSLLLLLLKYSSTHPRDGLKKFFLSYLPLYSLHLHLCYFSYPVPKKTRIEIQKKSLSLYPLF
ncbi:hypothetical protein F5880DRAFT_1605246, partial [Lentinula raphanica]